MSLTDEKYGWSTPPDNVAVNYINKCKAFVENDDLFDYFKRDEDYTKILEGSNRVVGDMALERIYSIPQYTYWMLKNFKNFKENDLYGCPVLHDYEKIGKISVGTLKYISNAAEIKNGLCDTKVKKIVEVGAGYGGLCKILSHMITFEEYIIIDLPPVVKLCEKYLNYFPELKDKISYISCEDFKDIREIADVDLFISDSALAECDDQTQKEYAEKIIKNSHYGYIIYNTHHLVEQRKIFIDLFEGVLGRFDIDKRIIVPGVEEYFLRKK